MSSVEVRLFIPATEKYPGTDRPLFVDFADPTMQIRPDGFKDFFRVNHLPGPFDVIRVELLPDRKDGISTFSDLKPGDHLEIGGQDIRHARMTITHKLASERENTL